MCIQVREFDYLIITKTLNLPLIKAQLIDIIIIIVTFRHQRRNDHIYISLILTNSVGFIVTYNRIIVIDRESNNFMKDLAVNLSLID